MPDKIKILMLEDVAADADILVRFLKKEEMQFDYEIVADKASYLLAMQNFKPDVILADHTLPQFNSVEALEIKNQQLPDTVFIIVTGTVSEEFVAEIIKKGADDYILKDRLTRLPVAIKAAIKQKQDERDKTILQKQLAGEKKVMEMIATGKPLPEVLNTIALHCEFYSDNALCSILLLNEEGTHIRHGAGPSLPDAYNKGIDGIPIGPVAGSCGTAAYRKERVIVADIANDPLWINYRDFALSFGLKASWSTPIINTEGKVYGTFAFYYRECRTPAEADLTLIDRATSQVKIVLERYYKEAQIKQSEEKYHTLVDQASDAIFIYDAAGNFLDANIYGCKLSGYTKEEILKKKVVDIIEQDHLKQKPLQIEDAKNGLTIINERKFIAKDGTVIEVELSSKMLPDGRFLGIARDITERKIAEQAIKESEDKFRTLVQQAADGIFIVDLEGNYLEANESAARLTGYSIEELKKMNAADIVEPGDLKKNPIKLEEIKTGNPVFTERVIKRKDKALINVEISAKLMSNGKVIAILRDITERKKAEETILQLNSELEQRVKERTAELENANKDLEEINDLFVGREARIIELKEELIKLKNKI